MLPLGEPSCFGDDPAPDPVAVKVLEDFMTALRIAYDDESERGRELAFARELRRQGLSFEEVSWLRGSAAREAFRNFSAQALPVTVWVAAQTTPMPPCATTRSRR